MKGIVRGVLALTLAVAAACTNDDTVEVGGDFDEVKVDRSAMFVSIGDSSAVLVRLVNDLNSSTPTSFTVSNVGAGIQVNYDPQYRPDYTNGDSLVAPLVKPQQRYWVVGTAIGLYQFTLSSSGASTTVNVYVTPDDVGGLSATTAVAGQIITITAPTGLKFTPASTVTFPTGVGTAPFTAFITNRAADSSSISFLVNPNTTGVATVSNVYKTYAPAAPLVSIPTSNAITVPALQVQLSTTSTGIGGTVVLTAPGALRFSQNSAVTCFGGPVLITNRAADGSTITLQAGPNIAGGCTVTNLFYPATPTAPVISLVSPTLTTPVLTIAPTTVSDPTPDVGEAFTVTLGGGLRFSNTGRVLVGGVEAAITALSADSSTATVVAALGSTGAVTFADLVVNTLPGLKLAFNSDGKTVVPTATFGGVTLAGTDAFATAPTIATPTVVGQSTMLTDNGGVWGSPSQCTATLGADTCKFYKIVVPGGQTLTLTGRFNTSADIGYYRFNSTFAGAATIADALGQSATNQEAGTLGTAATLTAGTWYIAVAYYGAGSYASPVARPTIIQTRITRTL